MNAIVDVYENLEMIRNMLEVLCRLKATEIYLNTKWDRGESEIYKFLKKIMHADTYHWDNNEED